MTARERWRLAGGLIPALGLVLLVARAEIVQRSGERFRLAVSGYDPRDLLRGHYLSYRYDFEWQGHQSCGPIAGPAREPASPALRPGALDPSCCLCLTRQGGAGESPAARQVSCDAVEACDGWLRASEVMPPQRYWVPEEQAHHLERALRERAASVDVTVSSAGRVSVGELYLDGRPWRDALSNP